VSDAREPEGPSTVDGGPELVQLLTPEGERRQHPDYPLDVSADELRALYRDLVLVRRVDTEATALQRQGELGIWASLLGQEAAQVGSGRALATTTTRSRPTASTVSPGVAVSTRSTCSGLFRVSTTAAGTPTRRTSTSTRS
jgi:hypothetical protein